MMALDAPSYRPEDVLVTVDRTPMGASLESRVPFMDHRIVEFTWKMPLAYIRRKGVGNWLRQRVLYRHVQRELISRPGRGFAVPLRDWLRGPRRDWARALPDTRCIEREGFFSVPTLRTAWAEHLGGRRNWTSRLWTVLIFQVWLEERGQ
jgi:asparagine synthase (glutamine-hydrolysing)